MTQYVLCNAHYTVHNAHLWLLLRESASCFTPRQDQDGSRCRGKDRENIFSCESTARYACSPWDSLGLHFQTCSFSLPGLGSPLCCLALFSYRLKYILHIIICPLFYCLKYILHIIIICLKHILHKLIDIIDKQNIMDHDLKL